MFRKVTLLFISFLSISQLTLSAEEIVELEPIVVTPWRAKESISDVSRGITVITREDIERSSANHLPELLRNYSGIAVADYFGNPKGTVVDIRGFGETSNSNVLVLIDGRRTNQVDLSGVDWGQISLESIERIEIVRGASTVLYGDNAFAGVINIITRRGEGKKPTVTVGGEMGSFQYKKGFVSSGGSSDFMDYFMNYSYQETSGYRANNDYLANDYFGKITMYPTDMFELDLSTGYHRDHYGMPGSLYPVDINRDGRRGTRFPDDRGFTSDSFVTVVPKIIFPLGDGEAMLSIFNSFRDRRAKGLSVGLDFLGDVYETETVHHITTYELRPKLEIDLPLGDINNKLNIGADYFYAKDRIISGNRLGDLQDHVQVRKETLGVYAHDSFKLFDKFLCNAGFRGEWADYAFRQTRILTAADKKSIREAAFSAGVGYKYNERSQIYFDFSRGYRLPNTEEYYQNKIFYPGWGVIGGINSDIKHQQSSNYEFGIRDVAFNWLNFGADVFLIDVKNEIYFEPSNWTNTNYGAMTRRYGLEFEANLDLFDGKLHPFIYYTWQDAFFKGGTYAGNRIPFVPQNKLSSGVTISPIESLNWTVNLNHVGSRYMISDQKNIAPKLKNYTTFDTTIDYTFKGAKAYIAIKNLFNVEYDAYGVSSSSGAETYYPAPEQSFEFGLSYEF